MLSSNSDANDIVKLLSESIKSTRATISLTQEMTGSKDTSIYVDNSLDNSEYRTGVRVSGALGEASLVSPKGKIQCIKEAKLIVFVWIRRQKSGHV